MYIAIYDISVKSSSVVLIRVTFFLIFSCIFPEISITNSSKKCIENPSQNRPGEFPGGVRGPLWSHLEANRADFERRRRSVKPLKRPGHLPHTSRTPPAHLPDVISEAQPRAAGLQKRIKKRTCCPKGGVGKRVWRCFSSDLGSSSFRVDFLIGK